MAQETLVDVRVDDGQALLEELITARYDVEVAFWVRASEEDQQILYIGSRSLAAMPAGESFSAIYSALSRCHPYSLSYSEVKVVDPADPIARAAIAIRDRHPARLPTRLRAQQLGGLPIEEAYIYTRETASMSREVVIQTIAALIGRMGDRIPCTITLKDGRKVEGIPTSIRTSDPGGVEITVRESGNNPDHRLWADEIVHIQ